ncbi:MAG TPA: hypothetical protein VEZ48_06765 [Sphingomonadaceae bacterium]|nr:hypothetical protein [Sphingomonadaceae bacterium]
MRSDDGGPGEAWFEYQRRVGGFRAMPVNAKGWCALVAAIAAPLLLMLSALPLIRTGGVIALVLSILSTNALVFLILWRLIRAKGRERL